MPRQSLASALCTALKKTQTAPVALDKSPGLLLNAIKDSTTSMDQIVQRRIGVEAESIKDLK